MTPHQKQTQRPSLPPQHSPGYTTKESQSTFPPLDLPNTSQLTSYCIPQSWGSCLQLPTPNQGWSEGEALSPCWCWWCSEHSFIQVCPSQLDLLSSVSTFIFFKQVRGFRVSELRVGEEEKGNSSLQNAHLWMEKGYGPHYNNGCCQEASLDAKFSLWGTQEIHLVSKKHTSCY